MKLKRVAARQGLQWVRGGVQVFLRQPLAFCALFSLVGLAALLLVQLPFVGPVAALALMPAASVLFMQASREVLAGRRVHPSVLAQPLRQPAQRRALLQLGAVYAVAAMAVVLLAQVLDGGRFAAATQAMAEGGATPAMLADPLLEVGVLLRLLLAVLLSLAFWHAPALVCWHGMPIGKAVFASLLACWRSMGAFMLYGLAWFGLLLGFLMLVQTLWSLVGAGAAVNQAVLPAVMLFSTLFYASLYFSYADSFEPGGQEPTPALPPP